MDSYILQGFDCDVQIKTNRFELPNPNGQNEMQKAQTLCSDPVIIKSFPDERVIQLNKLMLASNSSEFPSPKLYSSVRELLFFRCHQMIKSEEWCITLISNCEI